MERDEGALWEGEQVHVMTVHQAKASCYPPSSLRRSVGIDYRDTSGLCRWVRQGVRSMIGRVSNAVAIELSI